MSFTLHSLQVRSVRPMTNNPREINDLARYGIQITGRKPHVIPPNEYDRFCLETKVLKSGHYIDFSGKSHLEEQGESVVVEGGNR